MIDDLPDCVLPSSQKTGAGVFARSSASVASRSGGGVSSFEKIRFTTPQIRLIDVPRRAGRCPPVGEANRVPILNQLASHPNRMRLPAVLAPAGVRPLPPSPG